MFKRTALSLLLMVGGAAYAQSPTTQPTQPAPAKPQAAMSDADTEFQATQAFNRGQYAIALPLLQKLSASYKDKPDKLGPVAEMIRVSQKAIAAANVQKNATAMNPAPTDYSDRKPHPAPEAGKVQEMTIKELGNFDFDAEKGGNIPDDVKRLTGSQIRLRGYMIPIDQAERITKFALVSSLFECCFGQPPQIQHVVIVDCPPGKSVSYFPDELIIEGKIKVEEKKEDDVITSIYEVETSSVKPAPK